MKINLLFSYHYFRGNEKFLQNIHSLSKVARVLIDSGAYSNYYQAQQCAKKGKSFTPVTLEEYIETCHALKNTVWQYIMLDVLKNKEATRNNLSKMLKAGLKPMPVFVYGEDYKYVSDMMEINNHICVPGGVDATVPWVIRQIQRVYNASDGIAKIHALGFVQFPEMFKVPINSVDSSSWANGSRYGQLTHYDRHKGMKSTRKIIIQTKKRSASVLSFLNSAGKLGITRTMLVNDENYSGTVGIPSFTTIVSYLEMMKHAESKGLKIFLAISARQWLPAIAAAVQSKIQTGHYDYVAYRNNYTQINELMKQDNIESSKQMAAILSKT